MERIRQVSSCAGVVNTKPKQYDAAIAGCGPAGLATALALRARGFRVVAVDSGHPLIDKACGEGLMTDALQTARELGIRFSAAEGMHFRGIRFLQNNRVVQADFPEGPGLAVRRTTLHRKLVEQAEATGVEIYWNSPLCGLETHALLCRNARFETQWIIGADGLNSSVRRWAGLDRLTWNRERVGMRRHFAVRPWSDYVDVHWGEGCQCYITPVGPEAISVAFLARRKQARFEELLELFPPVRDRINGAKPISSLRGSLTALRRIRQVYKENVALVGDASGAVDAITGQGIGLALRQAIALAKALAAGDLRQYANSHAAIMRRPSIMAAGLSLMSEYAWIRELCWAVFTKKPANFQKLLALHVGLSYR